MGKESKLNMYQKMKSRYKYVLTEDGFIGISSFEHILELRKERLAFKEALTYRLNSILNIVNAF